MRRLLLPSALGVLWVIGCGTHAGAQPRTSAASATFKAPDGRYTVAVHDGVKVRDSKRNKELLLKIYRPEGPGRFPVLLFSHDAGGSKESFGPLARYWASHGYVSIHPSHDDALVGEAGTDRNSRPAALRRLLSRAQQSPFGGPNRATDLTAVIDALDQVERAAPELKGKLDRGRLAVSGHSFGALAAMLLGGITMDLAESKKYRTFLDPRVRAVLAVSPPGPGQYGLSERSWRKMTLPMLVVTGSQDTEAGRSAAWRKQPFELSRPGEKYLLHIQGANHYSFGGELSGGGLAASALGPGVRARLSGGRRVGFGGSQMLDQSIAFEATKAVSLAFWNSTLKENQKARSYLSAASISAESRGKASLSAR